MSPRSQAQSLYANRWVRRLVWIVLSVLVLWALSWSIVPPVLKSQLVKAASAELGRKLTVGDINFKPWTLELTVSDLAIATQDGAGTQLAVKRIYVDAELQSLLELAPVVQSLVVDQPVVHLRHRADGAYDIDDIVARFAAAPKKTESKPLRFALFNLKVNKGSADLDDLLAGRVHTVRDLNLGVPFLSNLASRRTITVTPELSFELNGSAFHSTATALPFAPSRDTDVRLRVQAMDLTPYLAYLPLSLPVRLHKAVLDTELELQFAQLPKPQLVVRGHAQLSGVELTDPAGQPLLAFDKLAVALDQLRPLEQVAQIGSIELQAPRLQARRDGAGKINLVLQSDGGSSAPAVDSDTPTASGAGAWQASVASVQVREGAIDWRDAAVAPAAQLQLQGLTLDAKDLVWPMAHPVTFEGALTVANAGAEPPAPSAKTEARKTGQAAKLTFEGSATDKQASVRLKLSDAPLTLAAAYMTRFLEPGVQGVLNTDMALQWQAPGLQLAISSLTLDQPALVARKGSADLPRAKQLSVSAANVDLAQHNWSVGKLTVTQPELAVIRGADKRWMFDDWIKTVAGSAPDAAAPAADSRVAPVRPWQGRLDQLQIHDAAVRFQDLAQGKPVNLTTSALNLDLRDIAQDGKQPMKAQLSARVASGQGQAGQLEYRGSVQIEPLRTNGQVQMKQIPLHALEPYFGSGLNIEILRADAGFKGDVDFAMTPKGPQLVVRGDTVLEDFRANSITSHGGESALAQELLNWKALGLRGVDLAMTPGKPLRLSVRETTLSDFYARVVVNETGRINLQDLVRSDAPPLPANITAGAAATQPATAQNPAATVVAAPVPTPATGPDPMAPVIQIGPITLVQGKVFFSDHFVKPNYSADLSELTGKLSAFSSVAVDGKPMMADLELRGRAEGTASLEIVGKLNPLANPLALDINGKVRDLVLPPLSPYSVKYAGHGIQRGKLSVDVAYQVLPNGQLTASNKVVLNQLAFGDKVEGAPNSLPVKLAVALLADSHGVIDINLPISGSLNDPQFKLGPVIFKVIVNLIGKALTAPFTLLASAFGGGGDELSQVAFPAGTAVLPSEARAGLNKVAKALSDRPALKMTVVGTANLEVEREAFNRSRLQELLRVEKRREQVSAGQTPVASSTLSEPALPPEEAAALLKQVFARSDISKPRDLAGKPKELTATEMEALLLANIPADDEAMRALALQRGVAVKEYLVTRQLPDARLFLGAAKLADKEPKWTPRAELTLGTN